MANEIKKVIEIQIKETGKTVRQAKEEAEAAAGSYKALSKEMSTLKKEWKETGDEAERADLGSRIKEINDQLKGMDASIGNFQRNVGNYSGAIEDSAKVVLGQFGSIGSSIKGLIPLMKKATTAATTGLSGVKKALVSTGIGALVVAVGLLVSNWDKFTQILQKWLPSARESSELTDQMVESNTKLLETNELQSEEMEYQARLMEAQGKDIKEVIAYKKKETQAIVDNIDAQIRENQALLDNMKAHSAIRRFFTGENKQIKELETQIESLTKSREAYAKKVIKFEQDITVETAKEETKRREAAKKTSSSASANKARKEETDEAKKKYQELLKDLEDYNKTELQKLDEKYKEEYEIIKDNAEALKILDIKYADDRLKIEQNLASKKAEAELQYMENVRDKIVPSGTTEWWTANINYLERAKDLAIELGDGTADSQAKIIKAENVYNEALLERRGIIAEALENVRNTQAETFELLGDHTKTLSNMESDAQLLKEQLNEARSALSEMKVDLNDIDYVAQYEKVAELEYQTLSLEMQIKDTERKILMERMNNWMTLADGMGSIMGSIADTMESEGSEAFEAIKGLRIAEATINTINGAISAFMGYQSYPQPWGAIMGGIQAAAVTAAGIAQIAQIRNTKIGGSGNVSSQSMSSAAAVTPILTDYNPEYTSNLTTKTETDNLANALSSTPIWVSVKDIDDAQDTGRVRVSETTF